jgi:hypothetical protein
MCCVGQRVSYRKDLVTSIKSEIPVLRNCDRLSQKMLRSCSKRQRMLFPLHRVHGDLDAKKDSVSAYVSFG